tara:strand:- start:1268 stop:1471 length:204 start_codon:yes stop_codon:yes gene_type:complete
VKNSLSSFKNKFISRYFPEKDTEEKKSSNINVLLNRVKIDQKRERIKKILFSATASLGILLFGIIIF